MLSVLRTSGQKQLRIYEGGRDASALRGSKSFNFMQFFGKIWQNRMLAPLPAVLAPPPQGNPGSATEKIVKRTRRINCHVVNLLSFRVQEFQLSVT